MIGDSITLMIEDSTTQLMLQCSGWRQNLVCFYLSQCSDVMMTHLFHSAVLWQLWFLQIPVDWQYQPHQPESYNDYGDGNDDDDNDVNHDHDYDYDDNDHRFQLIGNTNHINPHLHVDWSASEKRHSLSSPSLSWSIVIVVLVIIIMTRSNHVPTMFDRPGGGRKKCTCGGKVHLHIQRKCFTHSGYFLKTNHFSDNVVFLTKYFQARSTKYSARSDWIFFLLQILINSIFKVMWECKWGHRKVGGGFSKRRGSL